ncbi:TPA: serine hydroxymethyltransferase [Pseudomonas putida]|jgi:glycine hydroxymethyltransferase|uniref:Serine hydroxymethyltransferase n=1 Tax=Pseudomonas putida (strain GB-1) TaxID=76869 RepID=B0KGI5_PSEPG|nr:MULTISPECIES: serine hydroxymethyltransferase [Pseudomonas]ABY98986.1 Glycine hydroxymethyltransferase [Pseudomonas putida GB-1]APE99224.1 serine hydroxymethyltransferase [Pseudomonas putida]MBP0708806.1 serine hydroxymethyltransferase [Pseudomonas sp. T34]MCE1001030.1 serine hydroxymethyltransferase [Pseudomonas sp. NMI1173_11]MCK2188244.1 serine hydroxymethyltransferase [Pseudomonas sp. MB04B]
MFHKSLTLSDFDPALSEAIRREVQRQEDHIELIASENYTSPQVMQAQGTELTNKYAEGYPGKRYYGGCEHVDVVEQLAIERARQLFGAGYANVQPHSGSQANAAVYLALLQAGDTLLGMSLAHGGHLTHGAKVSASGKLYNAVQYGIDANGLIDYDEVERLAVEHQPKMIVAGFSAYSKTLDFPRFRQIADKVGAYLFVDMAHVAGLVAAGLYPNPLPYADVVTTTTHKTLRGPRGGLILAKADPELEKKLNSAVFPGGQGGPLMHVIAAKAVCFKEALEPGFKDYQRQVVNNAQAMAQVFMQRGFDVVSGGTDNHLFLLSLIRQGITGKDADAALGRAHITVNKNAVPNDPQSPFVTSGLRIGTPAVTTRGFKEAECRALATWICDILDHLGDADVEAHVAGQVGELCKLFPVYPA